MFRSTDTWISRLIARLTASEFTHIGLVTFTDNGKDGIIIEADRFIKSSRRAFRFDPERHALYRIVGITDQQATAVVAEAIALEGRHYDYLQIMGLFFRLIGWDTGSLFNRANSLICSELLDKALHRARLTRKTMYRYGNVTPHELLNVYEFEEIRS